MKLQDVSDNADVHTLIFLLLMMMMIMMMSGVKMKVTSGTRESFYGRFFKKFLAIILELWNFFKMSTMKFIV